MTHYTALSHMPFDRLIKLRMSPDALPPCTVYRFAPSLFPTTSSKCVAVALECSPSQPHSDGSIQSSAVCFQRYESRSASSSANIVGAACDTFSLWPCLAILPPV